MNKEQTLNRTEFEDAVMTKAVELGKQTQSIKHSRCVVNNIITVILSNEYQSPTIFTYDIEYDSYRIIR